MSFFNAPSASIGQELLNVPFGDMVTELAVAIADAQMALDENSIEVAEMMGGLKAIKDEDGNVTFSDSRVFFGTETITLQVAVERYNASSDSGYKALLAEAMFSYEGTDETTDFVEYNAGTDKYEFHTIYTVADPAVVDDEEMANRTSTPITISRRMSMLELGFTPTFYQFVDTIIEVKISIKYTREGSVTKNVKSNTARVFRTRRKQLRVTTSQVNATYASKYSYTAEGSSLIRTKLVPIPPPQILEERIRLQLETELGEAEA